jgi:hypothetical protein
MSKKIKHLAQAAAGKNPDGGQFDQAATIVQMDFDLRRTRLARAAIMEKMSSTLSAPESTETAVIMADLSSQLLKMDRYERRTLSRRKLAIRFLTEISRAPSSPVES